MRIGAYCNQIWLLRLHLLCCYRYISSAKEGTKSQSKHLLEEVHNLTNIVVVAVVAAVVMVVMVVGVVVVCCFLALVVLQIGFIVSILSVSVNCIVKYFLACCYMVQMCWTRPKSSSDGCFLLFIHWLLTALKSCPILVDFLMKQRQRTLQKHLLTTIKAKKQNKQVRPQRGRYRQHTTHNNDGTNTTKTV